MISDKAKPQRTIFVGVLSVGNLTTDNSTKILPQNIKTQVTMVTTEKYNWNCATSFSPSSSKGVSVLVHDMLSSLNVSPTVPVIHISESLQNIPPLNGLCYLRFSLSNRHLEGEYLKVIFDMPSFSLFMYGRA